MRVLFLNDLFDPRIGSSIRQMYQHAARLRELGHATAVVSTTPDRSEVGTRTIEGCQVHLIHSDYPMRFRACGASFWIWPSGENLWSRIPTMNRHRSF